ncbi:MAG: hypothetical protein LBC02_13345 [Planctomycetaceae bacterium]|jgi:hypothetical protein|nr:hypothetical protein [Planctomycetaceae bacterium]
MNQQQRTKILSTFRYRLFGMLFLKKVIAFTAVFLFLWGIAILTLRVGGWYEPNFVAISLTAYVVVPLLAWLTAWKLLPDDRKLGAILDRDNQSGGLVMSSFEKELGDWNSFMKTINIPKIYWQSPQTIGLILFAFCFAVISLLLPVSAFSVPTRNRLNVEDQVRRLTSQLNTLEEENILEVEEVETRKIDLERIQNNADGLGPVKTFDALDHIENRMNQKVAEAVENAQRTTETLAEAEALSQQVQEISSELDESTAKSLMEGLAHSLEEMLAQNSELAKDLKETLEKTASETQQNKNENKDNKNGNENKNENEQKKEKAMMESLKKMMNDNNLQNLTPEMLQQLCETMKQCQGNCERMCESLQNAGFPIDQDLLKKLSEAKKVDREEAERMLSDLWANCDGCNGECPGAGDRQGERKKSSISPRYTKKQDWTTDPNEEPGDTRFTKDADEEGAEFKATFLPLSDLEAFRNSQKIGASISSPDFDPNNATENQGGAITKTDGGNGTAHNRTIYPQHRGTVERFFKR